MPLLRDVEEQFKNSVIHKEMTISSALIEKNGLTPEQRLNIYRNNFFVALQDVLITIYPTINKLVGADFFTGLANEYILRYPSQSSDIQAFGHRFAEFVADFEHTQVLPYLPEIAALEWAYHEVFHEENGNLLDIQTLQSVPEEKYPQMKFGLHPASRLLAFHHPVLQIWDVCHHENAGEEMVNLTENCDKVLIIRRHLTVEFEKLSEGEFMLLLAFQRDMTFTEACQLALQTDPALDVQCVLQDHLLRGTIVQFHF